MVSTNHHSKMEVTNLLTFTDRLNKERCRDLERRGLMTDFGLKVLHDSNDKAW